MKKARSPEGDRKWLVLGPLEDVGEHGAPSSLRLLPFLPARHWDQ